MFVLVLLETLIVMWSRCSYSWLEGAPFQTRQCFFRSSNFAMFCTGFKILFFLLLFKCQTLLSSTSSLSFIPLFTCPPMNFPAGRFWNHPIAFAFVKWKSSLVCCICSIRISYMAQIPDPQRANTTKPLRNPASFTSYTIQEYSYNTAYSMPLYYFLPLADF